MNRDYAVGGLVNQCGLGCFLGLVMARNAGVPVDEAAVKKSAAYFGDLADRGSIQYGDHEPSTGPCGNGKNAGVAIAFDLLGDTTKSHQFGRYATDLYSDWENGHSLDFFGYVWNILGGLRTPDIKDYIANMQRYIWLIDVDRSWEGAGLLNDSGDGNGRGPQFCTAAVGMPFAIATGRGRLSIMGAPRSPFCPGVYSPTIERARQLHFDRKWDEVEKLLSSATLSGEEARQAHWILDAAKAAKASVSLTLDDARKNLDRAGDPDLAARQLEDLNTLLGANDARVAPLLARATDTNEFRAVRDAASAFKKYQWLVPLDETAKKEMEKLAADPAAGRYQQFAKEQLADKLGSFKFLYEIEKLFYVGLDTNTWDNGRSREFKLFKRVSGAVGGTWPQYVALDMLRKSGYERYDDETIKGWTALVPISGTRGAPKSARIKSMPGDKFDHGPAGWMMPGFDDSSWQQGGLPVGSDNAENVTKIKDGRAFCARVTFSLDDPGFDRLRLLFKIRHFANVYLNGHLVSRVLRYSNDGGYGEIYDIMDLKDTAAGLLKKGENVLAVEGTWDLWWGTVDIGLYGQKGSGGTAAKTARGSAPAQAATTPPTLARSDRYRPLGTPDAQHEAMKKLAQLPLNQVAEKLSGRWLAERDWAAQELARRGAEAMPAILTALASSDVHVRAGGCQAINYMRDAAQTTAVAAVAALVKILDDKDPYIQYVAGSALDKIGVVPDDAFPTIRAMLMQQGSWWPRCAAQRLIEKLPANKFDALVAGSLIDSYGKEQNYVAEEGLGRFLGRLSSQLPATQTVSHVTADIARHEGNWTYQAKMYALLKAMGPRAKEAIPLVDQALKANAADKQRTEFLQDVKSKIAAAEKN